MSRSIQQSATAPAFDLAEIDEDHLHATALGTLFMIWRRRTTVQAFSRGLLLAHHYSEQMKSKIGCCQVVESDAIPPDAEARKAFNQLLKLDIIARSALIYEGTGFKAASVRAIVNLQLLMSKPLFPHALFSAVKPAAVLLANERAELALGSTAASIEALIIELRSLHRSRFP